MTRKKSCGKICARDLLMTFLISKTAVDVLIKGADFSNEMALEKSPEHAIEASATRACTKSLPSVKEMPMASAYLADESTIRALSIISRRAMSSIACHFGLAFR